MKKSVFALSAIFAFFKITSGYSQDKPNIVIIAVDDWNDWVGPMGNRQVKTPNLDKLAKMGVTFHNAQTPAHFSTPSRTAILTGLYPATTGCYADEVFLYDYPELVTLPKMFNNSGYEVVGGGKVFHHMPGYLDLAAYDYYYHWNPNEKKKGWGLNSWSSENKATPKQIPVTDVAKVMNYSNFDFVALPNELEEEMADTKCFNWAAEYLSGKHSKPFLMTVGSYAPHKANYVPKKYFDLYPLEKIQLPIVKEDDLDDVPEVARNRMMSEWNKKYSKLSGLDKPRERIVQAYLAACSYADAMVGKILAALEKGGYQENTIIVLWSDNGYHLGEKKHYAKHTLWQRTTNIPYFIAGPGIPHGGNHYGAVSTIDTYPTLLELAGISTKIKLDGISLVPVLKKPLKNDDRTVVTSFSSTNFSAVNSEWRYISYGKDGEELYDIKNDPNEWNNLASKPAYLEAMNKMRKQIPQSPLKPATDKETLRLICDPQNETFRWEKKK
ncbi:MAG: sulfatase [Bacteroidia bacterium]|nr:sulfatase [Bacteroidia bacterium]